MPLQLKAIVFRTVRFKETLEFFREQLGCVIIESSPTHFVIHSQGIRILFVDTNENPEIEFYFTKSPAKELEVQEDPNNIKIIVS